MAPPTGPSIERLALTNFRNHGASAIDCGPCPQVLVGENGAGKTAILEALSLLVPGQGLRRAPFADLVRAQGDGGWAVAARVNGRLGSVDIGTGQQSGGPGIAEDRASRRVVRIDGAAQSSSNALSDHLDMVWLTPAMDGLFAGPAAERRHFLDRLVVCFDPAHGRLKGRFERAMQSRNRLLADGVREVSRLAGFEKPMAEAGVAMAAARNEVVDSLKSIIDERARRAPEDPFPWAIVSLEGTLESALRERPALEVEDRYLAQLGQDRERDRAAGRTLVGPHRTDLAVGHGPKGVPARLSSTGEQKALLIGLVLAQAELIARRHDGAAPILLLDEIGAHLDPLRRAALFGELIRLGVQAWLTGTDAGHFSALIGRGQFWTVSGGAARPMPAGSEPSPYG